MAGQSSVSFLLRAPLCSSSRRAPPQLEAVVRATGDEAAPLLLLLLPAVPQVRKLALARGRGQQGYAGVEAKQREERSQRGSDGCASNHLLDPPGPLLGSSPRFLTPRCNNPRPRASSNSHKNATPPPKSKVAWRDAALLRSPVRFSGRAVGSAPLPSHPRA